MTRAARFESHLDEGVFLWGHWEHALLEGSSPIIHFADGLDERLVACEEELSRAPSQLLAARFEAALEGPNEGNQVAALALALLESDEPSLEGQVMMALPSHPKLCSQILRALQLSWRALDAPLLAALRSARTEPVAATLLRALAWRAHRFGSELEPFLQSHDTELRAATLLCAPFASRAALSRVEAHLHAPDETVRQTAWQAALCMGSPVALPEIRQAFDRRIGCLNYAMMVLATTASLDDLNRLEQAAADPLHRRQVLWALGTSGWPQAADLCLRYLADETVSDIAADSFEAITGIRVARVPLHLPEEDGNTEAPAAGSPTRWKAPAATLPAIFEEKSAHSAWESRRPKGRGATERLLRGSPMTGAALVQGLWREPLSRRHARALELGLRSNGQVRFETLTWGWHQIGQLRRLNLPPISCQTTLNQAGR